MVSLCTKLRAARMNILSSLLKSHRWIHDHAFSWDDEPQVWGKTYALTVTDLLHAFRNVSSKLLSSPIDLRRKASCVTLRIKRDLCYTANHRSVCAAYRVSTTDHPLSR